jgi:hypothetical protein
MFTCLALRAAKKEQSSCKPHCHIAARKSAAYQRRNRHWHYKR